MAMTVLFLFRFFAFCVLQRKYVNKKKKYLFAHHAPTNTIATSNIHWF